MHALQTPPRKNTGDYGTDGNWGLASDWLWGPFHGKATTRHAIMQVLQGPQVTRPLRVACHMVKCASCVTALDA